MTKCNPLLATVAAVMLPAFASAQTITCPEPAEVFDADGSASLVAYVPQLASIVSGAELEDKDLAEVANTLRTDYPEASDAEVADLMIAGYCAYLQDEAKAAQRNVRTMEQFEEQVYNVIFSTTEPEAAKPRGWKFD